MLREYLEYLELARQQQEASDKKTKAELDAKLDELAANPRLAGFVTLRRFGIYEA